MINAELISRAQAGEEHAFAQLVLSHERELGLFLCRRVNDHHVAEDLLQDTFLAAWKAIRKTSPDLRVRPWLYKIALNAARQWERRQRILHFVPFHPHQTTTQGEALSEQDDVQRVLQKMRREDAELLLLKTAAGLTYSEIGALLRIKPAAVRQRLHRARERFRALYSGEKEAGQ
jgi:RNA polymerase sigma-70 factor (ECF subfamily)